MYVAGASSPACGQLDTPGSVVVRHGDSFGVELENTMHNTNCHWELDCAGGESTVTFTWFDTESGWDYVNLFSDGSQAGLDPDNHVPGDLGSFDGTSIPADVTGATLVQYITDASVLPSPSGFLATLSCGVRPCPPGSSSLASHSGCLSAAVALGYGFESYQYTDYSNLCTFASGVVSYAAPASIEVEGFMCELEDDGSEANGWRSYTSIGSGQCTYGTEIAVDEHVHSTALYGFGEDSDAHIGDIAAVCFALCDSARTEPPCVAVYARPGYCTLYHSLLQTATPSGSEVDPAWPTGHCYQREEQSGLGSCAPGQDACPVNACWGAAALDACCSFEVLSVDHFDPDECMTSTQGDACYAHVDWLMNTGINENPEWYPSLTPESSFEEFQCALAVDPNFPDCIAAPCGVSCAEGLFFNFEMPSSGCLPEQHGHGSTGEECTSSVHGLTSETNDCGVCSQDEYEGTGFIMYSEADVHSRMSVHADNYANFVGVKNEGGQWLYDSNSAWFPFTPADTDVLVASVDYTADTVTSLQGQVDMLDGVRQGFDSGDLAFSANTRIGAGAHGGGENAGEFFVSGSFFSRGCDRGGEQAFEVFEVNQFRDGVLIWTGEVRHFGIPPNATSTLASGRQAEYMGDPTARPFEIGDILCVPSCPATPSPWQVVLRETRAEDPTAYSATVDGVLRTLELQAAVPAHTRVRLEW